MNLSSQKISYLLFLAFVIFSTSCKTTQPVSSGSAEKPELSLSASQMGGGSSGMAQIDDYSYLVVYDTKNFRDGVRLGMVTIKDEEFMVEPIVIDQWDEEGKSSDLESVCKIPGRTNEFLIAESGNWKEELGRIFHIRLDTANNKAMFLGSTKLPFKDRNDIGMVGDQYEAMLCLPLNANQRILILGERGGSEKNPQGLLRWGTYDLTSHQLTFNDEGMQGIAVSSPGKWTDTKTKRDLTDLFMDAKGGVWASASEDQGDSGPFYSVVYKLGQLNEGNQNEPINVFQKVPLWKELPGVKIEALSGPTKGINSTHSFGSEDESYGGVWRPISIEGRR